MSAPYLVAYDIREPRRLRRVHYRLKKLGLAIQYSVFVVEGHGLMQEVHTLLQQITAPEDDIRIYRLHSRQALWMSGRESARPPKGGRKPRNQNKSIGLLDSWFVKR